ncbi:MAG TPA: ionic transporter y4hA [Burkholderiales bacterium]|nr:ionic transporter y4hA [Burkholderiales bacterium]
MQSGRIAYWTWMLPLASWIVLAATFALPGAVMYGLAALALFGAVISGVHHAEVVAHRIGEPFGTLVLAVAVTVIEVALIVSVMLSGGADKAELARDTVFAAIMICCNGIVGLCLLVGGIRHHEQGFQVQGASAALAVLSAMSVLTMVLPNYSTTVAGPGLSSAQLVFAGCISLLLYLVFVFIQTVRHRDYFLADSEDENEHAAPPSARTALLSLALLIVALVAVVGLAKALSPIVESGVGKMGAPAAVVGIIIAALVLMPEGLAALRNARANRLQNSLNLALGSALASIGLTIPTVAAVSLLMDKPIVLGLIDKEIVLLALTLIVGVITLGTGRTTILQGVIHLVIFAAFLFFAFVP